MTITGKLHPRKGWTRFGDYDNPQDVFWKRVKQVGSWWLI